MGEEQSDVFVESPLTEYLSINLRSEVHQMQTFNAVTDTNELAQHENTLYKALKAGFDPKKLLKLILQYGPGVLKVLELFLDELPKTTDDNTPLVNTPSHSTSTKK